jgi:hypothetical protein
MLSWLNAQTRYDNFTVHKVIEGMPLRVEPEQIATRYRIVR